MIRPAALSAIRQSRDVRGAMTGTAVMLRRGLHGAKNWILERDDEGRHASVWVKGGKLLVVLLPVLLVVSAVTGGPERGGRQTSFGSALFGALVLILLGLAVFSARERRAGREEPWEAGATTTGSTGSGADRVPDMRAEKAISPQVSEVGAEGLGGHSPDRKGIPDETAEFTSRVVTRVVTPESTSGQGGAEGEEESPFGQVSLLKKGGQANVPAVDTSLVTPDGDRASNTHIVGTVPIPDASVPEDSPTEAGHLVTSPALEREKTQVGTGGSGVSGDVENLFAQLAGAGQTVPVSDEVTCKVPEGTCTQVDATPGEDTGLVMATPGPYGVTGLPISDDWWLTPPDPAQPRLETQDRNDVKEATGEEDHTPFPLDEDESRPVFEGDSGGLLQRHRDVLLYLALKSMTEASEEERETVRQGAVEWVRREVRAGRQSQRSAARALGVSKTTVVNWLGRPAGDEENEERED